MPSRVVPSPRRVDHPRRSARPNALVSIHSALASPTAGHRRFSHALTRVIPTSPDVSSPPLRPGVAPVISRAGKTSIDSQVLESGDYQDVCPDCGSPIVGATIEDVLGAVCACHARRAYRYLTELVCTLCSRVVATVGFDRPMASIWVPRQLRCSHCGGQPLAGETVRKVVYPRVPLEQPRRGRPPRWLVEQRRVDGNAS